MPLPIKGLIHVTGEPDTGKTTFALTVPGVQPSQIIFFDDDSKTQSLADNFVDAGAPLGLYVNLQRETNRAMKPLEFYNLVTQWLEKAKKVENPQVLIFDNFARMESAVRAYSMSIMLKISDLTEGQIRGMSQMTWRYTWDVYAQFLDLLQQVAPLVIIITHVREKYMGNTKSGLLEAQGQKPLVERANLRVWTRHNPAGPAPIGLILKRIQKMVVTPDGLSPVNVLPRKVNPCTWARIVEYMNNPVGDNPPTADQMPNEFELSILDGTLTADQKDSLRIARKMMEDEVIDLAVIDDPKAIEARGYASAGLKPPAIAARMEITVPEVLELLK